MQLEICVQYTYNNGLSDPSSLCTLAQSSPTAWSAPWRDWFILMSTHGYFQLSYFHLIGSDGYTI